MASFYWWLLFNGVSDISFPTPVALALAATFGLDGGPLPSLSKMLFPHALRPTYCSGLDNRQYHIQLHFRYMILQMCICIYVHVCMYEKNGTRIAIIEVSNC